MATIRAALEEKDYEKALTLIRNGADVNAVNAEGKTALRFAASMKTPDILLALLEKGALVNFQGPDGTTALMIAARNSLRNTEILLSHGARVDLMDDIKQTVIFYAVLGDEPAVIPILVASKASINLYNQYGNTPLILAATKGKPAIVAELLRQGADPSLTDKNGITALGHSIKTIHDGPAYKEVYSILRSLLPAEANTTIPVKEAAFKVLCDPIGYDQHSGECWVDTIQQLFFFSDAVRNYTQPLFYNLTNPQLDEYLQTAVRTGILEEVYVPDLRRGLAAMRNRFINHYNYIRYNEKVLACLTDGRASVRRMYNTLLDAATLDKRIRSGEQAVAVGAALQSQKTKSARVNGVYVGGENRDYGLQLFASLFYIFRLPFLCKSVHVATEAKLPIYALTIGLHAYGFTDGVFAPKEAAHATGFFRCGGRWSYYDDNKGALPISDMFVNELKTLYGTEERYRSAICVASPVGSLNIYFLIMEGITVITKETRPDIPRTDRDMKEAQFEAIWLDDKWVPYNEAKRSMDHVIFSDLKEIEEDVKIEFYVITSVKAIIDDPSVPKVRSKGWGSAPKKGGRRTLKTHRASK
jgi:ankyrin repeat protein